MGGSGLVAGRGHVTQVSVCVSFVVEGPLCRVSLSLTRYICSSSVLTRIFIRFLTFREWLSFCVEY